MKVHPEIREKFEALLMNSDKSIEVVRLAMFEEDRKAQMPLLKGNCEIKIDLRHEIGCAINSVWTMAYGCNCKATRTIMFIKPVKKALKYDDRPGYGPAMGWLDEGYWGLK